MIAISEYYYTENGYHSCCGEVQTKDYCYKHNNLQDCAFCSGYAYWEPCMCDE